MTEQTTSPGSLPADSPRFPQVASPDSLSAERLSAVLSSTPRGLALGRLAPVAVLAAGWQARTDPQPPTQARVVVFAGDNGIAQREVSAYAPEASLTQAEEITAGAGPVNALARVQQAGVRLVDVCLDHDVWGDERVSRSCPAIDEADAMSPDDLERALAIGARIADSEVDAGADLLIPGELGVGGTTVTAALMGAATRTEPVSVIGPGSGITDETWKIKVTAIRDAMFRARGRHDDTEFLLRTIGSPVLAALNGFIAQAAVRRTPVLLDGAAVTAAAFLANRLAPGTKDWCLAGDLSPEPAHLLALNELGLTPLLALDTALGQGCGAITALGLVRSACELAGTFAPTDPA
ncbi:nicotinate-nucleotide--dimethylbenzimidazole phosphoribosyltransferase [Corynebacterium tapiri]|uniref:Nicotinate-nucleotide--dimethylbenzimidazole phosphoribosyltransferase n=1 Tax=Corynebacterium tapiri TaxID=1448266 RepID=A0A5C4U5G1_9CORY|nr:nicotinate-nucleotide--dimethylbenzimidazole phosphoribosyltransferase [Corynebacterium tapiri]TNL99429.1 nicotinate-nucleotide--dimethylbenzimidazole phosphoribosyltransferase [Corynebacterium tapiri]